MMIVSSVSCLLLIPNQVKALEPISTVIGIVAGPIFCKMIESNYLFAEYPEKNKARLAEMRSNFKWGGYYENGECVDSYDKELDKQVTACYIEGQWRVNND
jgi:hypothetical protein